MSETGPSRTVAVSTGADIDPRFRYATTHAVSYNGGALLAKAASNESRKPEGKLNTIYNHWNDKSRNKKTGFLVNQQNAVAYDRAVDESEWFNTDGVMNSWYSVEFTSPPSIRASVLPDRVLNAHNYVGRVAPSFEGPIEESGYTRSVPIHKTISDTEPQSSRMQSVFQSDYKAPAEKPLYMALEGGVRTAYVTESAKTVNQQPLSVNNYDGRNLANDTERFKTEQKLSFDDKSKHRPSLKEGMLLKDGDKPSAFVKKEASLFERGHATLVDMYARPAFAAVSASGDKLPVRDPLNKAEAVAGTLARELQTSRLRPKSPVQIDERHYITETGEKYCVESLTYNQAHGALLCETEICSGYVTGNKFGLLNVSKANSHQKMHPSVQRLQDKLQNEVDPVRPNEQKRDLLSL